MKIVVDVNVLLSGLIKDSTRRRIILKSGFDLYFPKVSFEKIQKYKAEVLEKSKLNEVEYNALLKALLGKIKLVSTEDLMDCWDGAKEAMEKVDPEDVVFIAVALRLDDARIWSDDRHFEKQARIKVLKTKDMQKLM